MFALNIIRLLFLNLTKLIMQTVINSFYLCSFHHVAMPVVIVQHENAAYNERKAAYSCQMYSLTVCIVQRPSRSSLLWLSPVVVCHMIDDERQVEECRQDETREGKRRVLRAGKTTSASAGHHQPVGQGVNHTTDDQLPQDESGLSGRSVYIRHTCHHNYVVSTHFVYHHKLIEDIQILRYFVCGVEWSYDCLISLNSFSCLLLVYRFWTKFVSDQVVSFYSCLSSSITGLLLLRRRSLYASISSRAIQLAIRQ